MTGFWPPEPLPEWKEYVPLEAEYVDILRACLQTAADNIEKMPQVNGKTITIENIEELANMLGFNCEQIHL